MQYDIIIVGAGPAGISTALHLANISREFAKRILILESKSHPRPKLCAGGILQDGEYILDRLGMDLSNIPRIGVNDARFEFEGRGFRIKRNPESFYVIRREEFDYWLVKEARNKGITIQENTKVLGITPISEGVKVITDNEEYISKIVVGADGSNSIVRRSVLKDDKVTPAMALELYVPEQPADKWGAESDNAALFDFSRITDGIQGYVWDFPMRLQGKPARNRGIFSARLFRNQSSYPNLKNILGLALSQENIELEKYQLKGHPIRSFDINGGFSSNRVLLVGDAAGVDPIFGEGISFALGYGELAAKEIKQAFDKDDFSFSQYKKNILEHPMGKCLKRRLFIAKLLYSFKKPWIQKLLWWRLGFILKWYTEKYLIDWAKK